MSVQKPYQDILREALEDVFVVAVRRGLDTRQLAAVFDADREPGPHQDHSLTISVRDTSITVKADGIPHDWISAGTGFIDSRFSQRIAKLLSDLEKNAQREGRFI